MISFEGCILDEKKICSTCVLPVNSHLALNFSVRIEKLNLWNIMFF